MIIEEDVEDFLEHYGVKGMKWGVRKDRASGGPGTRYERMRDRRREKKATKKATKKAANDKAVAEFTRRVIKDVGSRDLNELYLVGKPSRSGRLGEVVAMTGREFLKNVDMGMQFDMVDSTGYKFDTSKTK